MTSATARPATQPARRGTQRLLALLPATALLSALTVLSGPLGSVSTPPAAAATSTSTDTGRCRDGGGVTWTAKVTWGGTYADGDRRRVRVSTAGWTTSTPGRIPTDSTVKTYDGTGRLVQTLTRSGAVDYQSGTRYATRNPADPVSTSGRAKVTVTVGVDGDGKRSCTITFREPKAGTSTAPRRKDATPGWLSGASSGQASDGSFGAWRGSPVEIVGFWVDDPALYPIGPKLPGCSGCGEHHSWKGPIDMAVAPPSWSSWADEANGQHDAFWTAVFRHAKKLRAGKGTTYVRPWFEYNGTWFPYSVRPGEEAAFKRAFRRINAIQDREFPAAKLMLGTAASQPVSVARTWPGSGVDVLNIDFYNTWPFCTTTSCFKDKIENGAGANSLEDLRRLAKSKGVPVAIGEWSNQGKPQSAWSGGGGESPQFMRDWNRWLRTNAGRGPGHVLYEVQFNLWSDQYELFTSAHRTTALQPKTAAEYRRLW